MSNNCQLAAAHCAGGFDFPAPTRSWFGPVREYLVNEIQKAEIIAMLITRRQILRPVAFAVVLVMWVMALAALVWLYGAGRDNPTPTDLVVMTVLIVARGDRRTATRAAAPPAQLAATRVRHTAISGTVPSR